MKRLSILCILCMLCFAAFGESDFPETEISENTNEADLPPEDKPEENPHDIQSDVVYRINQVGDQFMILKLNLDIPYRPLKKLKIGGSGTLGYQRFVIGNLTVGGDISFAYSQTIGKNVFYFVPILFRAGWQFSAGKFEIPLSFGIGASFENYMDRMYFGLTLHPDAALFYRYNSSWSFGLHTGLYILPQWYKNKTFNYTGIIQDIGLTVRYHF